MCRLCARHSLTTLCKTPPYRTNTQVYPASSKLALKRQCGNLGADVATIFRCEPHRPSVLSTHTYTCTLSDFLIDVQGVYTTDIYSLLLRVLAKEGEESKRHPPVKNLEDFTWAIKPKPGAAASAPLRFALTSNSQLRSPLCGAVSFPLPSLVPPLNFFSLASSALHHVSSSVFN
jgi:hypothetical protein